MTRRSTVSVPVPTQHETDPCDLPQSRICPICRSPYTLEPVKLNMFCTPCMKSYARARRKGSGDELDTLIWAADRARRSVRSHVRVHAEIEREIQQRVAAAVKKIRERLR